MIYWVLCWWAEHGQFDEFNFSYRLMDQRRYYMRSLWTSWFWSFARKKRKLWEGVVVKKEGQTNISSGCGYRSHQRQPHRLHPVHFNNNLGICTAEKHSNIQMFRVAQLNTMDNLGHIGNICPHDLLDPFPRWVSWLITFLALKIFKSDRKMARKTFWYGR